VSEKVSKDTIFEFLERMRSEGFTHINADKYTELLIRLGLDYAYVAFKFTLLRDHAVKLVTGGLRPWSLEELQEYALVMQSIRQKIDKDLERMGVVFGSVEG